MITQQETSHAGDRTVAASRRRWLVLLAVGVSTFMSALDGSIVSTILPIITGSLHATVAATEWVITTYLLVISGLLLGFGRLGDIRGHRTVYLAGFLVFVGGSALCAMSSSIVWLVASRALQAVGAACLMATAPAIITANFPARQRGQALGLQGTMTYLGLTTGPALGGWLAHTLGWRSVFTVNIPIGLLAMAMGVKFIPRSRPSVRREPFDVAGAAVYTTGLVVLLLVLNQGHAWGWLSGATIGGLLAAGGLLWIFISLEWNNKHPMLDLTLFANRFFSASATAAVLNFVCGNAIVLLLPFYLITGRRLDPSHAGLILCSQPLVMALVAPFSGTLSDHIGPRTPASLGMGVMALGLFLLSRLTEMTPLPHIWMALMVCGLGAGLFSAPNNSALMGAAPKSRQGVAAGIMATARNFGMALGIGLAGAILTTVLARHNPPGAPEALFEAVRAGLLTASGIAVAGMGVSLVRGK